MKCEFCFATFQDVKSEQLPKGHLPKEETIEIVNILANAGFKKITFAGGEPLLCPWINELIKTAKIKGMSTMVITNGSRINESFLKKNKKYLDWIGISIDSLQDKVNIKSGRRLTKNKAISEREYISLCNKIKTFGYKLKINTVIHKLNHTEDFNGFIKKATPLRWKVMKVLPVKGQNDNKLNCYSITENEFSKFIEKHKKLKNLIPENNSQMTSSYVMIDPAGRFFDNSKGKHTYSKKITHESIVKLYNSMNYNYKIFIERGGDYNF